MKSIKVIALLLIFCCVCYVNYYVIYVYTHNINLLILALIVNFMLFVFGSLKLSLYLLNFWRKSLMSSMHKDFIRNFSLLAVGSSILVLSFCLWFMENGLEVWFSKEYKQALNNSLKLSREYVEEEQLNVKNSCKICVKEIERSLDNFVKDKMQLQKFLNYLVALTNLDEAIIINEHMQLIAHADFSFTLMIEHMDKKDILAARKNIVFVLKNNKILAIVGLNTQPQYFLCVIKDIKPEIVSNIKNTKASVKSYFELDKKHTYLKLMVILLIIFIGFMAIILTIYISIKLADRLIGPIDLLIKASKEVVRGKLNIQIPYTKTHAELIQLTKYFNKMLAEINKNQRDLININTQLKKKQSFNQNLIDSNICGIISADCKYKILLFNAEAKHILERDLENYVNKSVILLMPALQEAFNSIEDKNIVQMQIRYAKDLEYKQLLVKIVYNKPNREYIINFINITHLMESQKQSAWSDVARRIAHEIKNPLTPIELSAYLLKKRYSPAINEQKFVEIIDTILRQVGIIGKLVTEFSKFARISEAKFAHCDLINLINNVHLLEKNANPAIEFEIISNSDKIYINLDEQLISQAILNIYENAVQAINMYYSTLDTSNLNNYKPKIKMTITENINHVDIGLEDNGIGIDENINLEQLWDPSYTTKSKGTGLGLSIVNKIIEEHKGKINFIRQPMGVKVNIYLPKKIV